MLHQLASQFAHAERSTVIVLLGMAGVGKTEVLIEHVRRTAGKYGAVRWFAGGRPQDLTDLDGAPAELPVLVVLDAAADPEVLDALLRFPRVVHVLVTSRHRRW